MEKVMCQKCNDIGYTASPKSVRCRCGERLTVINEPSQSSDVRNYPFHRSVYPNGLLNLVGGFQKMKRLYAYSRELDRSLIYLREHSNAQVQNQSFAHV